MLYYAILEFNCFGQMIDDQLKLRMYCANITMLVNTFNRTFPNSNLVTSMKDLE